MDEKLSNVTRVTSLGDTDLLYTSIYVGGNYFSRAITKQNLKRSIELSNLESFTYTSGSPVFTLSLVPNNVDVYVGRVWQIPTNDYTLSGTDVTLTYTPDIGDKITIRPFGETNVPEQFTATEGQTDFTLSRIPNNLDVYIGRVWQIPDDDYTILGNILTFTVTPLLKAGDIITVRPY